MTADDIRHLAERIERLDHEQGQLAHRRHMIDAEREVLERRLWEAVAGNHTAIYLPHLGVVLHLHEVGVLVARGVRECPPSAVPA